MRRNTGTILVIAFIIASNGCITLTPSVGESPLIITDDLGREVTIPKELNRIVSLSPSNTEILFSLGLGDKVVGVTSYCNYPPEAQERLEIGGFVTVNIEKVVALRPDLVLADSRLQKAVVEELEKLDLSVVALRSDDMDEILEDIELIGKITGREGASQELTANMRKRIKAITDNTKDLNEDQLPHVLFIHQLDPLSVSGPGSLAHILIQLAGGLNIAADVEAKSVVYNLELLIERDPDVIIFNKNMGTIEITVNDLKGQPGWNVISAVKNDRVYGIDGDVVSRKGPRIVDGLEEMARCIHPELFE
ncbi:MAG: ABC transporter substrate-binding protein [Methanocellales archaeon]|nr:ABC transporter substrate-binding protein [Methanocellales archaeon]MDD3421309.1 ABC transporter substrate-binding protein [Methanocellales archaeon]MDD4898587.1 ABC transporter substrate-binding protein [Methanocellales archaeon]MDD5446932.1 ABC transporter substrate-binding protein [Methanocellales archaeon]